MTEKKTPSCKKIGIVVLGIFLICAPGTVNKAPTPTLIEIGQGHRALWIS
jgi:hypothetical protein